MQILSQGDGGVTLTCSQCDKHEREMANDYCPRCDEVTGSYDPETLDPHISPLSVREPDVILTEAWQRSTFGMDCATRGLWV